MKDQRIKKWDFRYLNLAFHVANWSKDPSTRVGSVIVGADNRIISLGYNGFPAGVLDLPERYNDREIKLSMIIHAERNAMDSARGSCEGATLYSTLFPCTECAKGIINKGIKRVVTLKPGPQFKYNPEISRTMFSEAGVVVVEYGSMPTKITGKEFLVE